MDKKKKANPENPFTVDSDGSKVLEVPTISRLLNRKKNARGKTSTKVGAKTSSKLLKSQVDNELREITQTSPGTHKRQLSDENSDSASPPNSLPISLLKEEPVSLIQPLPMNSTAIEIPVEVSVLFEIPIQTASVTRVQAVTRKKPDFAPLKQWNLDALKHSSDPLGKAIFDLASAKQLHCALFLSIQTTPPHSKVPTFTGTATFQPGDKTPFWKGLVWDPVVVPELWNQFIQDGFIELPPPGPNTVATSNRNVVRSALGTDTDEWLTLVRIGTTASCRGILAVFSTKSISDAVKRLERAFSSMPQAA